MSALTLSKRIPSHLNFLLFSRTPTLASTLRRFLATVQLPETSPSPNSPNPSNTLGEGLAAEILRQKVGSTRNVGGNKVTVPKSDKKPVKAPGEKNKHWTIWMTGIAAATVTAGAAAAYFGRPFDDSREEKYYSNNSLSALFSRAKERYQELRQSLAEPMWGLPPPLPEPFFRPYTLVINMDETLIYSTWDKEHGWRHAKRPGVDYFLAYLSQFYEIVIFTSQSWMNAGPILEKLDPYNYAMYKLYGEATRLINGKKVKDLSRLNRDLSKVIIMDSNPDSFSLQPENGVPLKPWTGDPNDKGLIEYILFLEAIALSNFEDVRPVLKSLKDVEDIPREWARREQTLKENFRQQWEESHSKRTKRNLGTLLSSTPIPGQVHEDQPPPFVLDQLRAQVRSEFESKHEEIKREAAENLKMERKRQEAQLKEMKVTAWQLITQGPPQPGLEQTSQNSQNSQNQA